MKTLDMRQGYCRRAAQINQAVNLPRPQQRIRCCGRVLSEQEIDLFAEKKQGRGQGKGQRMGNGQGQGQGQRMGNCQGQG
ncbi:MAG: hypothetical protein OCD00_00345 [Colwellia sp.]